jgi:Domain of Unknown Function with PDB structure (DUF3857)
MKKILLAALFILINAALFAQKNKKSDGDIPAFGKVEKADLEMKDCNFDPKAEALVLLDVGELDYLSNLQLKHRVRIKILTAKGLDWANVHLTYIREGNAQDITGIDAQTYNLDASGNVAVTKVDKKLIYDKQINKKYNEKVFTFPEVKVGSIIEYKFNFDGVGLIDWYFQRSIPVKYSRYTIDLPNELIVQVMPSCSKTFAKSEDDKGYRTVKTYVMTDEPGFRDEPYIMNEDFYRDRLQTKLIAFNFNGKYENRVINWVKVIQYLMDDEDFGVQVKKNIPHTAELDEKLSHITSPYEKMKTIYKYVQDNMEWNNYTGIWALEGVKSAWKHKKGTVGEINLILVNLLKDADLMAHPVLVSTHDNGVVNTVDAGTYGYPGFHQFDKVMAFVQIDGKEYVLDASQKGTPAYLIPSDVLMTEGLVIEKLETFDWGWHTLWNKDMVSKNIIVTTGDISETGQMKGETNISSYDYARLAKVLTARQGKEKFIEKYLADVKPGTTIDDVAFDNLEGDSLPLVQHVKYTMPLNSSGDYMYFTSNILSGLEKNPFIADTRVSDVFFGSNQSYTIMANFQIPDGYEFETLPKNVRMIMPDTSITITRIAQVSENILMTKIELEFKKPYYSAAQYSEFQEFYKRLFDLLNEQYVIHKKK